MAELVVSLCILDNEVTPGVKKFVIHNMSINNPGIAISFISAYHRIIDSQSRYLIVLLFLFYMYAYMILQIGGKIRRVYPPKNFLSPISLKVREIIVRVDLFQFS